jgi:hypothetical protein
MASSILPPAVHLAAQLHDLAVCLVGERVFRVRPRRLVGERLEDHLMKGGEPARKRW